MVSNDKHKKAYEIFGEKLECDEEIRFFGRMFGKNKEVTESTNFVFYIAFRIFFGVYACIGAVLAWVMFWRKLKEDPTKFAWIDMSAGKLVLIILVGFTAMLLVMAIESYRKSFFPLIITDRRVLYKEADGYQSVYYKNIKTHVLYNYITHKCIEVVCLPDDDEEEKNDPYSENTSITDYAYYMVFGDLDKKHKKKSEQYVTKYFKLGKGAKEAYKVFEEAAEPFMSIKRARFQDECGVKYENADDYLRRKQINMEANGEQVLWTNKQTKKMKISTFLCAIIFMSIICALIVSKAIIPLGRDISLISGEGAAFAIGCCVLLIILCVFALFVVGLIFRSMISSSETVVILTNRRIIEFVYVKYIFTRKSTEQYIEFSNINSYYSTGYVSNGECSRPLLIRGYVTEVSEEKKNTEGCISISYHYAKAVKEMLAEAIENAKKQNLHTDS
ncbi:MAG: hypothetical protein PUB97_10350 [Ruminococcus sp.]|nr:hypothetical protein [Ruminococcus sp.]